jgi:multicomponent Na+:H+ antiporter subunit A
MLLSLVIIFIGAIFSLAIPESLKKFRGYMLASLPLFLFVYYAFNIDAISSGSSIKESYTWIREAGINFTFYLDGLSILFALLISGIGFFILIYANDYMKNYHHSRRFYFFIVLFMGSMMGLVLSSNLISLFLFWELTSITSFFLIGFLDHKEPARKAAIQALLITGLGGLALLSGIILLYQVTGTFELREIIQQKANVLESPHYLTILILFLAGIFTKSAQFPFHFWLPGAMQAPSPVSAFLHSATMVKAGIFLLFRISSIMGGTQEWSGIITFVGALTMFSGAYMSIAKSDLKSLLAHTTISALGILTMLIGINTKLSIKAAILFLIIHSLYKATLFMVAGAIDKQTGTREISRLGGLYRRMPIITIAALISLLSMSGLPPMLGFVGKELIYEAKVQVGGLGNIVLILGVASNVFLVWVSGMVAYRTFFGKERRGTMKKLEPGFAIWIGPIVLSLVSLALGLSPGKFGEMIIEPALVASRVEILDIKLKLWHGFNQVFFLSLATIFLGVLLFFLSERLIPVIRKVNEKYFNYDFAGVFSSLIDGVLLFSKKKTEIIQHGYHRLYLMIIFLFSSFLIFYQLISTSGWQFSANFSDMPFYMIMIGLIIGLAAIFTTITRSRMAAIVFLGVAGYGVALIYLMYGGIDLAITQILVETLTIILFVLVIKKLPKFKVLSNKAARIRDLGIALFAGIAMTGLTIKADFLNLNPSISKFFIEKSMPEGFGRNVVNVILVDFRALDTLGEITVLVIAAAGVLALLKYKLK